GGRLAARRAAVRFERMTEAAVVIAVGGHRVADRRGRAVLEQPLETAPVEHPGAGGDERGRRAEVWSVHRPMTSRAAAPVLNETAIAMTSWLGGNPSSPGRLYRMAGARRAAGRRRLPVGPGHRFQCRTVVAPA